jgi:hypothetical protein
MTISFWINDPSVLFNKDYILDLWPTNNMCYEQKLNAITRLILLLTILGYILTKSQKIIFVGILTIIGIFILFKTRKQKLTKELINEGFSIKDNTVSDLSTNSDYTINPVTLEAILKKDFKEGTRKNPFSNVLLTDIEDEPNRKSAPPSFNLDVEEDITKNVKKGVQRMNPSIDNTNHQLYSSLWDKFELDQSNRVFYTTANTRIEPGDQGAFGKYLYGNMPSSKESDSSAAWQREKDSYRYTLY